MPETSSIFYGPTDVVDPDRLVPGAKALRYTESAPRAQLDTAVPCCGRIARLRGDFAHVLHLVLCVPCGLAYEVTIIDQNDGGYLAELEVRDEQPVLARRRADGWLVRQYQAS